MNICIKLLAVTPWLLAACAAIAQAEFTCANTPVSEISDLAIARTSNEAQRELESQLKAVHTLLTAKALERMLQRQAISQSRAEIRAEQEKLLDIESAFHPNRDPQRAAQLTKCLRTNAQQQLRAISRLADQSQLYEPRLDSSSSERWFEVGSSAVVNDYLDRQLARTQVLLGYATPYVNLLKNTSSTNDAPASELANVAYWHNSFNELQRHMNQTDSAGQAAELERLIRNLGRTNRSDCKAWLNTYKSAKIGNDLFSKARHKLEVRAKAACT